MNGWTAAAVILSTLIVTFGWCVVEAAKIQRKDDAR